MNAPPMFGDADYDAIFATVAASERGRWFLDEYARRHRGADTDLVLAAMARVEAAVRTEPEAGTPVSLPESVHHDVVAAAEALARLRQAIGYGANIPAQDEAANALPGLIDEIDWRLHNLAEALFPTEVPGGDAAPSPQAPVAPESTGLDDLTDSGAMTPSTGETGDDPLADLTAAPAAGPEASPAEDAMIEAAITDWAFADAEPQPPDGSAAPSPSEAVTPSADRWPEPPPPRPAIDWAAAAASAKPEPTTPSQPHMAALERIEAREYGRRDETTHALPELRIDDVVERPERLDRAPIRAALDELIVIAPFARGRLADVAAPVPPSAGAVADAGAGSMFDPDLFDAEHKPADVSAPPNERESGLPLEPSPRDEASESRRSSAESASDHDDTSSQKSEVSERLEQMRKSIAALMDEIAQKTGRPVEPPRS